MKKQPATDICNRCAHGSGLPSIRECNHPNAFAFHGQPQWELSIYGHCKPNARHFQQMPPTRFIDNKSRAAGERDE